MSIKMLNKDVLKFVGQKCKEYRKSVLNMNSSQFSRLTGYSRSSICRFEAGKQNTIPILLRYVNLGFNLDNAINDWRVEYERKETK